MKYLKILTTLLVITVSLDLEAYHAALTGKYRCVASDPKFSSIKIEVQADDSNAALVKAADQCANHLIAAKSDDEDIIDVCTNLRCK